MRYLQHETSSWSVDDCFIFQFPSWQTKSGLGRISIMMRAGLNSSPTFWCSFSPLKPLFFSVRSSVTFTSKRWLSTRFALWHLLPLPSQCLLLPQTQFLRKQLQKSAKRVTVRCSISCPFLVSSFITDLHQYPDARWLEAVSCGVGISLDWSEDDCRGTFSIAGFFTEVTDEQNLREDDNPNHYDCCLLQPCRPLPKQDNPRFIYTCTTEEKCSNQVVQSVALPSAGLIYFWLRIVQVLQCRNQFRKQPSMFY